MEAKEDEVVKYSGVLNMVIDIDKKYGDRIDWKKRRRKSHGINDNGYGFRPTEFAVRARYPSEMSSRKL